MEDNNLAVEARRRLVRSSRHRQKTSTARARQAGDDLDDHGDPKRKIPPSSPIPSTRSDSGHHSQIFTQNQNPVYPGSMSLAGSCSSLINIHDIVVRPSIVTKNPLVHGSQYEEDLKANTPSFHRFQWRVQVYKPGKKNIGRNEFLVCTPTGLRRQSKAVQREAKIKLNRHTPIIYIYILIIKQA